MSNEVQIRSSLQINKSSRLFQSNPTAFLGSVNVFRGPSPGKLAVSTTGVSVNFSQLTTPGYCQIWNLDATNYVEFGILVSATFYPLGEILPGESYILRLSRNLSESETVPGTATGAAGTATLYLRANTASCDVVVNAFDADTV